MLPGCTAAWLHDGMTMFDCNAVAAMELYFANLIRTWL
jgi:hypothetical protein